MCVWEGGWGWGGGQKEIRKIGMKMLIKIEILSFQVASYICFYWSIGFMIKMLI